MEDGSGTKALNIEDRTMNSELRWGWRPAPNVARRVSGAAATKGSALPRGGVDGGAAGMACRGIGSAERQLCPTKGAGEHAGLWRKSGLVIGSYCIRVGKDLGLNGGVRGWGFGRDARDGNRDGRVPRKSDSNGLANGS